MKHYDDSELIEVHYFPAENAEANAHLEACGDCATRLTALARTLRAHADSPSLEADAKPDFFWERQAVEIRRKIESTSAPSHHFARFLSIAAMLVLLVGASFLVSRRQQSVSPTPVTAVATTTASVATHTAAQDDILFEELQGDDAWSAEQLKPYRGAVEWETWLTKDQASSGGRS